MEAAAGSSRKTSASAENTNLAQVGSRFHPDLYFRHLSVLNVHFNVENMDILLNDPKDLERVPGPSPSWAEDCCRCWRAPTVWRQSSTYRTPESGYQETAAPQAPPRESGPRSLKTEVVCDFSLSFIFSTTRNPSSSKTHRVSKETFLDLPSLPSITTLIPGSLSLMKGGTLLDGSPSLASSRFLAQIFPWTMLFCSCENTGTI